MNHLFDQIRERIAGADRMFIETPDGGSITYGDMLAASGRFANTLQALDITPGDRVAVQVDKSAEALLLYLACVRAGAVFLPLNPAYTTAELTYFFGDAEPRLIVCSPNQVDDIRAVAPAASSVETLGHHGDGSLMERAARLPTDFSDVDRSADDLAAILYTSGTTGRSKGAMLTHENLASNARTLVRAWRFTAADTLIHALPIFHTHGLFVATNTILFAGAAMLLLPNFDPQAILDAMPRATSLMGVPTFYTRLLQHPGLDEPATEHMRLFVSGSAPLLAETHKAWFARTGHAILERYGMTETNMNTSNPYDGDRVPGTVGLPLPGVSVRITEPDGGEPLPCGQIGMIEVRGPNVFSGYWRMPEKTATEFRDDGYFITGDLGQIDANGYVTIVGRGKDVVITGGLNVYPKEVESVIDRLDGVVESAVIGLPHPDFGEAVTAVVVRANTNAPSAAAVMAGLGDELARYKQPKHVAFVDALPRNAMGKVQKNVLRDRYATVFTGDSDQA
ncbi:malonate--CoA ligase [Bauldia sp.]|uniref:malonate--CoA ligase n=1 Tax=Bauldia sp. TaxID=2575872 RepID=UPI003BAB5D6C